ncbi:MAG: type III pantothenate kinase, partial [Fusobacteriaceae bacterium]|nr:type III pantothenate kinase [Fusobacteriaceae bacterium]
ILGRDTVEQIQAGIFFGYVGQIREIIRRVKEILPDVLVIATGGLGENISMELSEIDVYLPNLATDGLFELYKMNRKI